MKHNPIETAARQLRDAMDRQHAANVSALLGCPVTLIRRQQLRVRSGRYVGVAEPVYAMPAEFVEQALTLGIRAEAR